MHTKVLLKVGDAVSWKGSWGRDLPLPTKVLEIEIVRPGEKEGGENVKQVQWHIVESGAVVVVLDNGHWAYGHQISPVSTKKHALQETF